MDGDFADFSHASDLFTGEGAVHEQVGIAADGAGEMGVIDFGEAVVADGLRGVTGALEALEQAEFDGVLLGLADSRGEEALEFAALGEVAGAKSVAGGQFAKIGEAIRIGIFVNPVDGRDVAILQRLGHDLIGGEHALLDELMRNIVFHLLEPDGATFRIKPDFDLGEIEIERAGGEAILAEERGGVPECELDALAGVPA